MVNKDILELKNRIDNLYISIIINYNTNCKLLLI